MTNIDDDLIAEAEEKTPIRFPKAAIRRAVAAAACIVFVVAAVFAYFATDSVKIIAYGTELSASPIAAHIPSAVSEEPTRSAKPAITVPLEIDCRREITVEALDGTFEAFSSDGETVYSGTIYEGRGKIVIEWTIYGSDTDASYTLAVGNEKIVLYNDGTNWKISKTA